MDCSTSELPGGKQKGEALSASQVPLPGPVLSAGDGVTACTL